MDTGFCITTLSGAGITALSEQIQWLKFEDVQLGKLYSCGSKTIDVMPSVKKKCLQPKQHAFSQTEWRWGVEAFKQRNVGVNTVCTWVCVHICTYTWNLRSSFSALPRDWMLPVQSRQNVKASWFGADVHTGSHFLLVLLHLKWMRGLVRSMWRVYVAGQWWGWCWVTAATRPHRAPWGLGDHPAHSPSGRERFPLQGWCERGWCRKAGD